MSWSGNLNVKLAIAFVAGVLFTVAVNNAVYQWLLYLHRRGFEDGVENA
jgi:hypothetical protein